MWCATTSLGDAPAGTEAEGAAADATDTDGLAVIEVEDETEVEGAAEVAVVERIVEVVDEDVTVLVDCVVDVTDTTEEAEVAGEGFEGERTSIGPCPMSRRTGCVARTVLRGKALEMAMKATRMRVSAACIGKRMKGGRESESGS